MKRSPLSIVVLNSHTAALKLHSFSINYLLLNSSLSSLFQTDERESATSRTSHILSADFLYVRFVCATLASPYTAIEAVLTSVDVTLFRHHYT